MDIQILEINRINEKFTLMITPQRLKMIKSIDSNCENSIYESITYICDNCGKELTVHNMDELKELDEIFDLLEESYDDKLLCLVCSSKTKDKK